MQVYLIQPDMQAEITELITYPIKSCAGIKHTEISIGELGLQHDRLWMLVDEKGQFLSQRKHAKMALIKPEIVDDDILINAPGMPELTVNLSALIQPKMVTIWKDTFHAQNVSKKANLWFSEYLGFTTELVKYTELSHRKIDPDFANSNQKVAFADGFPILVTHESTLNDLNQKLSHAVSMSRFRPNIVVKTNQPAWDELNWSNLNLNELNLSLVKPCARCIITGIEQDTGQNTGTEVLKTLRNKFPHKNKAVFGINAIPEFEGINTQILKLGMTLHINQKDH